MNVDRALIRIVRNALVELDALSEEVAQIRAEVAVLRAERDAIV